MKPEVSKTFFVWLIKNVKFIIVLFWTDSDQIDLKPPTHLRCVQVAVKYLLLSSLSFVLYANSCLFIIDLPSCFIHINTVSCQHRDTFTTCGWSANDRQKHSRPAHINTGKRPFFFYEGHVLTRYEFLLLYVIITVSILSVCSAMYL